MRVKKFCRKFRGDIERYPFNIFAIDKKEKKYYLAFKNSPGLTEGYYFLPCSNKSKTHNRILAWANTTDLSFFTENDYLTDCFPMILDNKYLPEYIGVEYEGKDYLVSKLNKHIYNLTKKLGFIKIKPIIYETNKTTNYTRS
jgi:hypothetical protein